MPAELELGLDQFFPGGGPKLFETGDLDMRERLEREVRERGAAPQPKGFAQEALRCSASPPSAAWATSRSKR